MRRNRPKRRAYRVKIQNVRGDDLHALQAAESPLQALTLVANRWISSPGWKGNPPAPWHCTMDGPRIWKYFSCAFDAEVQTLRFDA